VRASPRHGAARRIPRTAGNRRRRAHRHDDRHHQRHHPAAPTWPLPGLFRRDLRRRDHYWAAVGGILCRPAIVALDILCEPSNGRARARSHRGRVAVADGPALARHRLCRRCVADPCPLRLGLVHQSRRHELSVVLLGHSQPDGGGIGGSRCFHHGRASCRGTNPAARTFRKPEFLGFEYRRVHRGRVAVRLSDLSADLSPSRERGNAPPPRGYSSCR
jgi:hypothetical protein